MGFEEGAYSGGGRLFGSGGLFDHLLYGIYILFADKSCWQINRKKESLLTKVADTNRKSC